MTNVMVQTESTAPNRRAWTVVDGIENAYLHLARFVYGMWTSPFAWFIFGILVIIQHPQTWWMLYIRDIVAFAFIANFGRLWHWHDAIRKEHVKALVDAKNGVSS